MEDADIDESWGCAFADSSDLNRGWSKRAIKLTLLFIEQLNP